MLVTEPASICACAERRRLLAFFAVAPHRPKRASPSRSSSVSPLVSVIAPQLVIAERGIATASRCRCSHRVVVDNGVAGHPHHPGDTIVYDYSVENTGNVTLFNVALSDDQLGAITLTSGLTDEDLDGDADDLAVGATATGEATATLTQAQIDAGSVTNIADVTGDDPNGDPVTDSDTNTVSIDQNPALNIVKDADKTFVVSTSDVITYTYTVTNTGNVSLTNVVVTDDNFTPDDGDDFNPTFTGGDDDLDGKLGVDETWTYTSTHQVTQAELTAGLDLVNVATADSEETGPDTDDATVDVIEPPITVTGNPQFNFPNDVDKIRSRSCKAAASHSTATPISTGTFLRPTPTWPR